MGTEVQHQLKHHQKSDGLTKAPAERRSVKQLVDVPQGVPRSMVDTNVTDLSSMDNVPLKDLFPNVKVRKRQLHDRKIGNLELSSPRNQETQETQDSTRSRLRESLTVALRAARGTDISGDTVHLQGLARQMQDEKPVIKEIDQKVPGTRCGITGGLERVENFEGSSIDRHTFGDNDACVKVEPAWYELIHHIYESETDEYRGANACQTYANESPFKKMRLNAEENGRVKDTEASQVLLPAEKVAFSIEAELFRLFGGVSKKYKEKARSLLFNLKDHSNPELRVRVLSGEITPANLCSMSAEHLASRELSQWRMAKAEEFAHMVVLTDEDANIRRLVKKTHKGEFEVQVEKDDVLTEMVTGGVRQGSTFEMEIETRQDSEGTQEEVPLDQIDTDLQGETECPELSPSGVSVTLGNISGGWIENKLDEMETDASEGQEKASELDSGRSGLEDSSLPTIMSLDEYFSYRKDDGEVPIDITEQEVKASISIPNTKHTLLVSSEINVSGPLKSNKKNEQMEVTRTQNLRRGVGSRKLGDVLQIEKKRHKKKNEKLWEGSFQLSGSLISPVLASFRSGERVDLQSWSNIVEVKGRVRLDALDKFLQELRLSRTRSVMIISCCIHGPEENAMSVSALKEVANQYEKGERVGYAEPAVGFELYLFPPGGPSLMLLSEHGYFDSANDEAEQEETLVGCIVWRRTQTSNIVHKASSHYYNANRRALSGQLDSPTRPDEAPRIESVSKCLKTSPIPVSNASNGLQSKSQATACSNEQNHVSVANLNMENANKYVSGAPSQYLTQRSQGADVIDDSPVKEVPQDTHVGRIMVRPSECNQDQSREEDNDDIPPGFGPMSLAMLKPEQKVSTMWDDDDLPEFDFASEIQRETIKGSGISTPSQIRQQGLSYQEIMPFPQLSPAQHGPLSFSLPQKPGTLEHSHISLPHISTRSQFPHMTAFPEQVKTLSEPHSFSNLQMLQANVLQDPPVVPPSLHIRPQLPRFPAVSHTAQSVYSIPRRPQILADGPFPGRPSHAVTVPLLPDALHTEKKNNAFSINLYTQDQRGLLGVHPKPVEHCTVLHEQKTSGLPVCEPKRCMPTSSIVLSQDINQSCEVRRRNIWDDDDMPEWNPPLLMPRDTSMPPLLPSPPIIAQANVSPQVQIPVRPLRFGQQVMPPPSFLETGRTHGQIERTMHSPGFRGVPRL